MVHFSTPVVVAALVIVPSIAAPIAQVVEEFEARDDSSEFEARAIKPGHIRTAGQAFGGLAAGAGLSAAVAPLFKPSQPQQPPKRRSLDDSEIEARAIKPGHIKTAGQAFGGLAAGAGLVTAIAPLFKPSQPPKRRSFDEDDLEARRYSTGAPLVANPLISTPKLRSFDEDDLEARRFGKFRGVGKVLSGAGTALGIASTVAPLVATPKRRSFDEDDLEARKFGKFRGVGKVLSGAGTALGIASTVAPLVASRPQRRSFEFEDIDTRAPPGVRPPRVNAFPPAKKPSYWGAAIVGGAGAIGIGLGAGAAARQKRDFIDFVEDDALEARRFRKLGKIAGGIGSGLGVVSSVATLAPLVAPRSFDEGDFELEARDFDDDLEVRDPKFSFATSVKPHLGNIAIGVAGAAGVGLGAGAAARSRRSLDFEDDFDARDFDELEVRDYEDLLDYYGRELDIEDLD